MNKLVFAAGLGLMSLVSLAGCKQIAEARKAAKTLKAAARSVTAAKGPASSSEEDKDAELASKLGQYISCMNDTSMFSLYLSSANTFLKSAKELLRRKRDNKDFNEEFFSKSRPNLVDGHPAQVVETYNRMVGESNDLRY